MAIPQESTLMNKYNLSRKRPLEHPWEVQTQQQFPDTVKQTLKNNISTVDPIAWNTICSDNAKIMLKVENRVPYNLQKLRLLSPKGRDLGEFKVKLKSADLSKGSTITITKSSSKPLDKLLILPLSPASHKKIIPRILKQGIIKIPKNYMMETVFCSKNVSQTNNSSLLCQQRSSVPQISKVPSNDEDIEGKMEEQQCNSNNINNASSIDETRFKNFVFQNTDHNNQNFIVQDTDNTNIRDSLEIQETAIKNNEPSNAETLLIKEIESQYLTKCRKSVSSSDKRDILLSDKSLMLSKGKCIATIKKTENGKVITYLKNATNLVHNQINNKLNLNVDLHNNSEKNFSSEMLCNENNFIQLKPDMVSRDHMSEIKTQNVMTIIPNNKILSFNQNVNLVHEDSSIDASMSDKDIANIMNQDTLKQNNNSQSEDLKTKSQNDHLGLQIRHISEPQQITDIKVENKKLSETDLSNRLDIIKKAMDSVTDNDLRELALKALADCGIGIEKYVPIHPKNYKTVHDTQVQTVVFGLLDPQNFILINKDLEDIQRLNQVTLHDVPDLLLSDNLSSNLATKGSNVNEQENTFDVDAFMEQFWKENSDALRMKETLSSTKTRYNSLLQHLERDFEHVKQYDQNGMLNIHKAVISDNIYLVRRQLMVLQYCKQSVDTMTENGMTSLELAIKYNVSSEIVQLLLDVGAQPAIPKSIHESALIIASKESSPLLPMLVERISEPKLLDQIDSDGFAALHYCSIRGNLEGVKALLSAGATIDLKDMKSGRTSLFHAIDNNHALVMQILLKAGAVANIANYAGQTALSIITDPKSMTCKLPLRKDIM